MIDYMRFLCGIHGVKFGALHSSMLSQDPQPTLDRADHAMLQEEQLQASKVPAASDVVLTMDVHAGAPLRYVVSDCISTSFESACGDDLEVGLMLDDDSGVGSVQQDVPTVGSASVDVQQPGAPPCSLAGDPAARLEDVVVSGGPE
ncbi:hypothetical protein LIER_13319 [Lithospermum erythrorhizon]|uniref:Uncharacterized protein n=1 Tax=Lithospermum erythrorhizon TaxID=34254 RepID=A0AAV3PY88_LITER